MFSSGWAKISALTINPRHTSGAPDGMTVVLMNSHIYFSFFRATLSDWASRHDRNVLLPTLTVATSHKW